MNQEIEEAAFRAYRAHLTARIDDATARRWWGQLYDEERAYWRSIARGVLGKE